MSIEDVHFSLALHPAASVGHRALARPLSDIAAMGGIPKFVLVSLALSDRTKTSWIKGFYNGLSATARRFGVSLVGGDTALTVTLQTESFEGGAGWILAGGHQGGSQIVGNFDINHSEKWRLQLPQFVEEGLGNPTAA